MTLEHVERIKEFFANPEVGDGQGSGLQEPPRWVVAIAGVGDGSSEPVAKET